MYPTRCNPIKVTLSIPRMVVVTLLPHTRMTVVPRTSRFSKNIYNRSYLFLPIRTLSVNINKILATGGVTLLPTSNGLNIPNRSAWTPRSSSVKPTGTTSLSIRREMPLTYALNGSRLHLLSFAEQVYRSTRIKMRVATSERCNRLCFLYRNMTKSQSSKHVLLTTRFSYLCVWRGNPFSWLLSDVPCTTSRNATSACITVSPIIHRTDESTSATQSACNLVIL